MADSQSDSDSRSNATAESTSLPDFDKQWRYDDLAETEKTFREILRETDSQSNANYKAQLLTQVARAQGLQSKFEAAHATLDEVEQMLNEGLVAARVRYYLERGRVHNSSGSKEDAKPLFVKAWKLAGLESSDAKLAELWTGPSLSF